MKKIFLSLLLLSCSLISNSASLITITGVSNSISIHVKLDSRGIDKTSVLVCSNTTFSYTTNLVLVVSNSGYPVVTIYDADAIEGGTTVSTLSSTLTSLIAACGSGGGGGGPGIVESVTSLDNTVIINNSDPAHPDLSSKPAIVDIKRAALIALTNGGTASQTVYYRLADGSNAGIVVFSPIASFGNVFVQIVGSGYYNINSDIYYNTNYLEAAAQFAAVSDPSLFVGKPYGITNVMGMTGSVFYANALETAFVGGSNAPYLPIKGLLFVDMDGSVNYLDPFNFFEATYDVANDQLIEIYCPKNRVRINLWHGDYYSVSELLNILKVNWGQHYDADVNCSNGMNLDAGTILRNYKETGRYFILNTSYSNSTIIISGVQSKDLIIPDMPSYNIPGGTILNVNKDGSTDGVATISQSSGTLDLVDLSSYTGTILLDNGGVDLDQILHGTINTNYKIMALNQSLTITNNGIPTITFRTIFGTVSGSTQTIKPNNRDFAIIHIDGSGNVLLQDVVTYP